MDDVSRETNGVSPAPDPQQPLTIVPPLQFDDALGSLIYAPQPNITAYETALCLTLFLRLMMWRPEMGEPAWRGFIMGNGLERHFVAPAA